MGRLNAPSAPAERPRTVPGCLARELVRVAIVRERYRVLQDDVGGHFDPVLLLIDMALEAAMQAADRPDVANQVAAVRELEGFTE